MLSKKLAACIMLLGIAVAAALFLFLIAREYAAASKYALSKDAQAYMMTCQNQLSASLQESDRFASHLTLLHYPGSIRLCSCVADRIAASRPDDVETSRIIFVSLNQFLDLSADDRLLAAQSLGDDLGMSEQKLSELVREINTAFKGCP